MNIATAQIADACIRLKVPFRLAPSGINPVLPLAPGTMLDGQVLPVRHFGSVDVFLEALAIAGDSARHRIMVIDNTAMRNEACIGDLVALECKLAGIAAIVINGLHRDTDDIRAVGLPVFSYGSCPTGPLNLWPRNLEVFKSALFGDFTVTANDTAFADNDGVLFIPTKHVDDIISEAQKIRKTELKQTELANGGTTLRQQFKYVEFMDKRLLDSSYTFRQHLSSLAKSIEE